MPLDPAYKAGLAGHLPVKLMLSVLMFIFTLVETGEKGTAPAVTIPIG